jgi:hypothetical protein
MGQLLAGRRLPADGVRAQRADAGEDAADRAVLAGGGLAAGSNFDSETALPGLPPGCQGASRVATSRSPLLALDDMDAPSKPMIVW